MNSIQRQIQPLNRQTGFNVNSIQRQIQPLNPQGRFNVNSIQRYIQPINPQMGFNVYYNQRQIVDEIAPELSCLNTMEQRLISRVQAFMKLIVLPLGQRALAGQTINFPVNVSKVYNSLKA